MEKPKKPSPPPVAPKPKRQPTVKYVNTCSISSFIAHCIIIGQLCNCKDLGSTVGQQIPNCSKYDTCVLYNLIVV